MDPIFPGTAVSQLGNAPLQGENVPQTCVSAKAFVLSVLSSLIYLLTEQGHAQHKPAMK